MSFFRSVRITLEMIKWEHSVLALPFALIGAMLAAHGIPHLIPLLWIIACMVTARSAAMAFNRWADARLDAENPRTAMRAIPAGLLSRSFVGGFTVVMSALFIFCAAQLNRLTFELAPVALAIVFFYSYTKRLTRWSHVFLGLSMSVAPIAAWIAIRGSIDPRILVLVLVVLFWGAGFDTLYACQDAEHDRTHGLNSVPSKFGLPAAFAIARSFHILMIATLIWLVRLFHLGPLAVVGVVAVAGLLLYEHSLVSPKDIRRMNAAFFTMNGIIAVVLFVFVAADLLLRPVL